MSPVRFPGFTSCCSSVLRVLAGSAGGDRPPGARNDPGERSKGRRRAGHPTPEREGLLNGEPFPPCRHTRPGVRVCAYKYNFYMGLKLDF